MMDDKLLAQIGDQTSPHRRNFQEADIEQRLFARGDEGPFMACKQPHA